MGGDRIPGPFNDAVDEETRRRQELRERHLEGKENAKQLEEALARARSGDIADFLYLDKVALEIHGQRCIFIRKYTDAWLNADVYNKRLMRPVFEALIRKYNLEEDPEGTGG